MDNVQVVPKDYVLYAALHEDIAEGFVWLKGDVQARGIIEITNTANNSHIVCEALQFESNFLSRYNKAPRISIGQNNINSSIVINIGIVRVSDGQASRSRRAQNAR